MEVKLYRISNYLGESNQGEHQFFLREKGFETLADIRIKESGIYAVLGVDEEEEKILDFYSEGNRITIKNSMVQVVDRKENTIYVVEYEANYRGIKFKSEIEKMLLKSEIKMLKSINESQSSTIDTLKERIKLCKETKETN